MEQKYYHMNIVGCERDLPLCPLNEHLMIGAFVIFGDPELTTACAAELLRRVPAYDYIITAEAKGIPLAHEMARLAGNQRYLLARKGPKLYMRHILDVSVHSITTDREQHLYVVITAGAIIPFIAGTVIWMFFDQKPAPSSSALS